MKIQSTVVKLFSVLSLCTILFSCKKETENQPSSCKIVSATIQSQSGNNANLDITYNADNRISTLSISGSYPINKIFTYNGNTIIINTTSTGGAFEGRDSITIDAGGRPLNIRHFYNQSGTSWHNTSYEYSGDNMVKFMQGYESTTVLDTYTVTSEAGNVVSWGNSGNSTSVEYFIDKTLQPGDYLEFNTLIEHGVSVYPRKNLVKRLDSGQGNYTDLSYEFNSEGKITKVIASSAVDVITFTYQYQCD